METIKIDVMLQNGKKFYITLKYQYNPLFHINLDAVIDWVYEKLPSLEKREDVKLIFY